MTELAAHGVRYRVHRDVYDPSDDSWLLADVLAREPRGRLLEVGTGTGVVATRVALAGHAVVATDVNPEAVRLARENAAHNGVRVDVVRADLLHGVRPERFDRIAFNPPYLPTTSEERVPGPLNAAFDGGPSGLDTMARFLESVPAAMPPVFVVTTTLQPGDGIRELIHRAGLHARVVADQALPHERLRVLRLDRPTRKG